MYDLPSGATHFFTFTHTAGLSDSAFTKVILKNGSRVLNIPVSITESSASSGIYTAQFSNDGTSPSHWSLIIYQTSSPATKHVASWDVKAPTMERNIQVLREQINSIRDTSAQTNKTLNEKGTNL